MAFESNKPKVFNENEDKGEKYADNALAVTNLILVFTNFKVLPTSLTIS